MKVSEVYTQFTAEVDRLQKQLKNNHRDQLTISIALETKQAQMKELMKLVMHEGDRELTGPEIMTLNLTQE